MVSFIRVSTATILFNSPDPFVLQRQNGADVEVKLWQWFPCLYAVWVCLVESLFQSSCTHRTKPLVVGLIKLIVIKMQSTHDKDRTSLDYLLCSVCDQITIITTIINIIKTDVLNNKNAKNNSGNA